MSQVEKDTWSRSAIEIEPGPGKCVKVQRKQALVSVTDGGVNKLSPSHKRNLAPSPVAQRPLVERIIHLLALKSYRKPELLRFLEREGVSPKDKADLSAVLDEVGKLNPKDHSYSLKEEQFRQVQREWPGFTDEEKLLIHRLLIRKLAPLPFSQRRSPQSQHPSLRAPAESPSRLSPAKTVKRPLNPAFFSCNTPKKQRLDTTQDHLTSPHPTDSRGSHVRVELYSPHKQGGTVTTVTVSPKTETTALASPSSRAAITESPRLEMHFTNSQHKKKHKKHKDKERERFKPDWGEDSPDQKRNHGNLKEGERDNTPDHRITAEELPDYFIKYNPITSTEQRRQYHEDFCAEYDEYRALHDHIRTITDMFIQLASKISTLSPGTQEHKHMEDRILQKYKKYKKRFPGYRDEKKRCQYLHQKLSHIKGLITNYDRALT